MTVGQLRVQSVPAPLDRLQLFCLTVVGLLQLLTGRFRAGDLLFVLGQLGLKRLPISGNLLKGLFVMFQLVLKILFLLVQLLQRLLVMVQFFPQIPLGLQQLVPFGGCGLQLIFLGTQLILKLFDLGVQCLIGLGGSV